MTLFIHFNSYTVNLEHVDFFFFLKKLNVYICVNNVRLFMFFNYVI